jgi:hypothetical protein
LREASVAIGISAIVDRRKPGHPSPNLKRHQPDRRSADDKDDRGISTQEAAETVDAVAAAVATTTVEIMRIPAPIV